MYLEDDMFGYKKVFPGSLGYKKRFCPTLQSIADSEESYRQAVLDRARRKKSDKPSAKEEYAVGLSNYWRTSNIKSKDIDKVYQDYGKNMTKLNRKQTKLQKTAPQDTDDFYVDYTDIDKPRRNCHQEIMDRHQWYKITRSHPLSLMCLPLSLNSAANFSGLQSKYYRTYDYNTDLQRGYYEKVIDYIDTKPRDASVPEAATFEERLAEHAPGHRKVSVPNNVPLSDWNNFSQNNVWNSDEKGM